ncbi:e2f-associated phospho [Nannochloropsis oceanica]
MEPPFQVEDFSDSSAEEDHEAVDELYDENADEEDEKWIIKHWRQGQALPIQQRSATAARSTDAVLNCPCCFTTVCMECQRHAIYKTQYRAMFIINCRVKTNENLSDTRKEEEYAREEVEAETTPFTQSIPPAAHGEEGTRDSDKQQRQHDQQQNKKGVRWNDILDGEAPVRAVECETCGTVVGVQDEDEVTHFFNVIAS